MQNCLSWQKRKTIFMVACALLFLIVLSFLMGTIVLAEDTTIDDAANSLNAEELLNLLDDIFKSPKFGIAALYADSSDYGQFVTDMSSVFTAVSVLFYFLIMSVKAMQKLLREEITARAWLYFLILYLVGLILLIEANDIFDMAYQIALQIETNIRAQSLKGLTDFTQNAFTSSEWLFKICSRFCLWLCRFLVVLPCWKIIFEIMIRRIFIPLAFVDTVAEGLRSPGAKYLKAYFIVLLRVGLCYAIAVFMGLLLEGCSELTGFISLLSVVGICMGGSKMMTKTQPLLNELFGV